MPLGAERRIINRHFDGIYFEKIFWLTLSGIYPCK